MSERGVIAVDRGIFTDPDFASEPFTEREAFVWIVSEAAWKDREARGQKGKVKLARGEVCHSVRFMAEAWQWSKSRVDRFIKRMVASGTLVDASRDSEKIYSVRNYNRFQTVGLPKRDATGTSSGTPAGQQRDKLEAGKHSKETPNGVPEIADERATILAEVMDRPHAEEVNAHRKRKGAKSWTPLAAQLLAKEFSKVREEGFDPNEAAEAMIRNGWQGFEADWFLKSKRTPSANGARHEQRHSHVQRGPAGVADHLANIVAREQLREPSQPDREGQLRPADRVQDRELSFERGEDGSFGGGGYGAPRLVAARHW